MADIEISVADEAQAIAGRVIEAHHPHLRDITRDILWLFTTQKRTEKGRPVLAKTQTLSARERFLSGGHRSIEDGEQFVVTIDLYAWALLSESQREALVDHELCHIVPADEDEETFRLRAHEVEEFTEIIERHGLWFPDLTLFARAASAQLALMPETP